VTCNSRKNREKHTQGAGLFFETEKMMSCRALVSWPRSESLPCDSIFKKGLNKCFIFVEFASFLFVIKTCLAKFSKISFRVIRQVLRRTLLYFVMPAE
jgi:hypothetical protein